MAWDKAKELYLRLEAINAQIQSNCVASVYDEKLVDDYLALTVEWEKEAFADAG